MFHNRSKFLRMKAQIERIDDAAGARNAEEAVHVRGVGPHHRADAVAGSKAKPSQSGSQAARAPMEIGVSRARQGAARTARHHFSARKQKSGAIQQVRQSQRKIHHRAAHAKASQTKRNPKPKEEMRTSNSELKRAAEFAPDSTTPA